MWVHWSSWVNKACSTVRVYMKNGGQFHAHLDHKLIVQLAECKPQDFKPGIIIGNH